MSFGEGSRDVPALPGGEGGAVLTLPLNAEGLAPPVVTDAAVGSGSRSHAANMPH